MDITTSPNVEYLRPMGRDTAATIALKPHWETLIPEAPHLFSGASDSMQVSPPIYQYKASGFNNQWIGMCVGKGTAGAAAAVLRTPAGATYDPTDPTKFTAPGPNIRLSGLYCYWDARNVHGGGGWGEGAVVAYSLDGATKWGFVTEDVWPDTQANQSAYSDRRVPTDAMRTEGGKHLILKAARITSLQMYMDYLASGFPVIDGVSIGKGWMNTGDDGAFSLGGRTVGGHCTYTAGFDKKLNRLYKVNSWLLWGAQTSDPDYSSTNPVFGGNAQGRNNVGYCPLDQYESSYLSDSKLASGETDAFVICGIAGFVAPAIVPVSAVDEFA